MTDSNSDDSPGGSLSPDRSSPHRWTTVLAIASAIVVFPAIATFFSRHFFIAEIVNNFRLQLTILTLVSSLLLFYEGFRVWAWLQSALALAVFYPLAVAFLPASQPPPGPLIISLMSFNILGKNNDQQPTLEMLKTNVTDILVVIEYENDWIDPLDELREVYPYHVCEPRWHGFGLALYSLHKINESRVHSITRLQTDNPVIVAELEIEGQSVIVCAAHFLSPISLSPFTSTRMKIRNDQMAEVASIIENIRDNRAVPVILVGDFNCVAWSPFAKDLMQSTGLRDSRQGFFYQGSWPTDNPLLRIPIDNAFVSPEIHVHDRRILSALSSDHYPLFLEFSISAE